MANAEEVIRTGSSSPFLNKIVLHGQKPEVIYEYLKERRNLSPEENGALDRILKLIGRQGTHSTIRNDVLMIRFSDEKKSCIKVDFSKTKEFDPTIKIEVTESE